MEPLSAVVAAGALVLGGVASAVACAAFGRALEARAGRAELLVERLQRIRAEALADERAGLLVEARALLADAAQGDAGLASLAAALRGVPGGDPRERAERLLRTRAAAAAPLPHPPGPGAASPPAAPGDGRGAAAVGA